jgi:TatD DNase family protein
MNPIAWLDTHCHLDAAEFDADREQVALRARALGVGLMVIPAVEVSGFDRVRRCAEVFGCAYTLGIHPLYVDRAHDRDLSTLESALREALADPRFLGVGEIGLDGVEGAPPPARQDQYLEAQLRLAAALGLPVLLHVRRAIDRVLAHLRRVRVPGGIAHAFNGSPDQAGAMAALGMRMGFGGASTYDGSLRIRRLAATLPAESIVLETDAPDIPPQWRREPGAVLRNEPGDLAAIACGIAALRGVEPGRLAAQNLANACAALPRLAALVAAGGDLSLVPSRGFSLDPSPDPALPGPARCSPP